MLLTFPKVHIIMGCNLNPAGVKEEILKNRLQLQIIEAERNFHHSQEIKCAELCTITGTMPLGKEGAAPPPLFFRIIFFRAQLLQSFRLHGMDRKKDKTLFSE